MRNPLLQSTIDLDPTAIAPQQTALAVFVLAALTVGLVIASYLMQFAGLDERRTREKKALLGQKDAQEAQTLILDSVDQISARRDEIRALFDGEPPEMDRITLRAALRTAGEELGDAWYGYASRIPRLARWLLELAVGLTLTASLVHISTATYRQFFAAGGGTLTIRELVLDTQWALGQGVTIVGDTIGLFPYVGVLWELTFAYSVLVGQWVYDNPLPVIALLVGAAAGVIWLDRQAPEARTVTVTERRSVALSLVTTLPLIWAAGALPAAVFGAVGLSGIGDLLGFATALTLTAVFAYFAAKGVVARTRAMAGLLEDATTLSLAYVVVRRLGYLGAGVALPLIPLYLVAAISTGKLGGVVGAFLAGSLAVQLAIGLLIALLLAGIAWLARDSFGDLRDATRHLAARAAVRAVLLRRGVPIVVVTFVYFLVIGFGLPAVAAVAAALTAGVLARLAYYLYRRVRYRALQRDPPTNGARQVFIRAFQLETADGEPRYYAEVNDVDLAHDDPDALVDAACAVAEDLFDDGETRPRVERAFAEDLLRFGTVSIDESRTKLRQNAKLLGKEQLAKNDGMIDEDVVDEQAAEEVPQHIWEEVKQYMRSKSKWHLRNGYLIRANG